MNTKNIFKAVVMAMLMPAVLLTTSCSKGDDAVTNPEKPANTEAAETAVNKGYALPVTVNVTRQGDGTRATYTDNGDGTGSLGFSTGDKLFVSGSVSEAGQFAGALDYVPATGNFSGTIYTENPYSGTADDLFTAASAKESGCYLYTTLLPAGYESYGFLTIDDKGTPEEYDDDYNVDYTKAFALTKAAGIEQFSFETADNYSGGFDLEPGSAILNFTVTGLPVSTMVAVEYSGFAGVSKKITTDASGNATFVIGDARNVDFRYSSLSVGGISITLVSDYMPLAAGKIYNITRAAPAMTDLATINENYTASNGEILAGTLASNMKISIADGATVTLYNVTINGTNSEDYQWAGISCEGDATIILSGTNTVKGFHRYYPGIHVPTGKTLTIDGTGSLNVSSNGNGSGIGGGYAISYGIIVIEGGTITATGGQYAPGIGGTGGNITINGGTITARGGGTAAGIGSGNDGDCGHITISGGTVTAYGGKASAGIGGGANGSTCVGITITSGVTRVTATKGDSDPPCSIGKGKDSNKPSTCGTVTIGGVVYAGGITESPYTYQPE